MNKYQTAKTKKLILMASFHLFNIASNKYQTKKKKNKRNGYLYERARVLRSKMIQCTRIYQKITKNIPLESQSARITLHFQENKPCKKITKQR